MILFIFGSRHFIEEPSAYESAYGWITDAITSAAKFHKRITIVHGGAIGTDKIAGDVADELGVRQIVVRPNYDKYGRYGAPHRRNDFMLKNADKVMGFWNGKYEGSGTASVILKAFHAEKDIFPLRWAGEEFEEVIDVKFQLDAPKKWLKMWGKVMK